MVAQIATVGGTVPFSELLGEPALSRNITATRKNRSDVRSGLISWPSIDTLLDECFPAAPSLPGQHPSVSYLYVEEVNVVPWPPVPANSDVSCLTTNVNYLRGLATIKYSTLPYDENDMIRRRASVSVDVMTLPANSTKWSDTGKRPQQEDLMAGKQIPMTDWRFDYFNVEPAREATLDQAVRDLIGHVNDGVYDSKDDQTLLFRGHDKEWAIDVVGDQRFTYGYSFTERRVQDGTSVYGWNHFYRNEDGAWAILLQKDGKPIYPKSANFADLFT